MNPMHFLWRRVTTICRSRFKRNENPNTTIMRMKIGSRTKKKIVIFTVTTFSWCFWHCTNLNLTVSVTLALAAPINFDFDCKLLKQIVGMRCQPTYFMFTIRNKCRHSIGDKFKYDLHGGWTLSKPTLVTPKLSLTFLVMSSSKRCLIKCCQSVCRLLCIGHDCNPLGPKILNIASHSIVDIGTESIL